MTTESDIVEAIAEAAEALERLNDLMVEYDHTGDYFIEGYPFEHSLDEVVSDMFAWFDRQVAK